MHTLHVVTEIPVAWEAISGNTTVASFVCAEEGLFTVSMHGVGLTLMSEETGRGWEVEILAGRDLTSVRLQVGVHEFADRGEVVSIERKRGKREMAHTRSCT